MLDVQTFTDAFRVVVQYFALALLGCSTAVAAVAWLARKIAAPMRRLLAVPFADSTQI